MENKDKRKDHIKGLLLLLFVLICTAMILLEVWGNVKHELSADAASSMSLKAKIIPSDSLEADMKKFIETRKIK